MKHITFKFNPNSVKIRRRWLINPAPRVINSKKVYNRREVKKRYVSG